MSLKLFQKLCLSLSIIVILFLSGCLNESIINDLPSDADVLFVSNSDTKTRRKEIYSLDLETGDSTRITVSDKHYFIIGIDLSKSYILATCAVLDTDSPSGLGDEDRKSLWLIDLDKKEERLLTNPLDHAEGDSFSPDGKWIVFFMRKANESQADIYKMTIDGSNLTQLTFTDNATEADPSWSHDGNKIAFSYYDMQLQRFVLKKMDSDGSNIELVYDDPQGVETPAYPPGIYDASWSPDNNWLVFEQAINSSGQNYGSGIWHIFKVKSDGSELIDLSILGNHSNRAEYLPSFSLDATRIIYGSFYESSDSEKSHIDIFYMNSDDGISTQITDNSASNMFPIWIS